MYREDQYLDKTDEQLLTEYRQGDRNVVDFLLEKYKNLVRKKARSMYLVGGDHEDLVQEGMIGLYKAIRDFDSRKNNLFVSFADLCITRQLYTAVQASLRKKHGPLNTYISFYDSGLGSGIEEDKQEVFYVAAHQNPEEMVLLKEQVNTLWSRIEQTLSEYEQKVLSMYLDGLSYQEISEEMAKSEKSIDNAIQRVKKKVVLLLNHPL